MSDWEGGGGAGAGACSVNGETQAVEVKPELTPSPTVQVWTGFLEPINLNSILTNVDQYLTTMFYQDSSNQ